MVLSFWKELPHSIAVPVLANPKHEAFAEAVAEGSSATKAYREHVAEPQAMTETCMANASRLMARAEVALRVQELRRDFADVLENRLGVRRETIARYLVAIITTPISEVHKAHEMCQEYSEAPNQFGTIVKCKMPSKLDAVEKLVKMAGWHAPQQIEHSGGITGLLAELTGAKQQ